MLKLHLQRFAEEGQTDTAEVSKIKVGDSEYTEDELKERLKSYDKLNAQFTKVTQENSELKKVAETAQEWLQFDSYIQSLPTDRQQDFAGRVQDFLQSVQEGTVTQKKVDSLKSVIKAAEKSGDDDAAKALTDLRDDALSELILDREITSLGKQAKKDGIEWDEDGFKSYVAEFLAERGLGENDEFDTDELPLIYRLYRADMKEKALEEQQKRDLPHVGTGGSGVGVSPTKPDKPPKNLREAHKWAMGRR